MTTQEAREILGLGNSYNDADVKIAFRQLAKRCHPDVGGTAGLFRIISEAQKILTGGSQSAPQSSRAREKTERSPRWNPFQNSSYVCPWDDFIRIILGDIVSLRCRGESFSVSRGMLESHWLHTAAPVTIEIRLWKNWLTRLLCKPKMVVNRKMAFKNNSKGSFFFDLKLTFSVASQVTNFYEVRIGAPWAKEQTLFTFSGSCRAACNDLPRVHRHDVCGLLFELTTRFRTQGD